MRWISLLGISFVLAASVSAGERGWNDYSDDNKPALSPEEIAKREAIKARNEAQRQLNAQRKAAQEIERQRRAELAAAKKQAQSEGAFGSSDPALENATKRQQQRKAAKPPKDPATIAAEEEARKAKRQIEDQRKKERAEELARKRAADPQYDRSYPNSSTPLKRLQQLAEDGSDPAVQVRAAELLRTRAQYEADQKERRQLELERRRQQNELNAQKRAQQEALRNAKLEAEGKPIPKQNKKQDE